METFDFCTCTHKKCPRHPMNSGNGCTSCIEKNLRLGEIPNCFAAPCEYAAAGTM